MTTLRVITRLGEGHRTPAGTPGHQPGDRGTTSRDTTAAKPRRRRRRSSSRTRVRRKGQDPRMTRAQLRTHVTHDTNTEHDFPVVPPTSDRSHSSF